MAMIRERSALLSRFENHRDDGAIVLIGDIDFIPPWKCQIPAVQLHCQVCVVQSEPHPVGLSCEERADQMVGRIALEPSATVSYDDCWAMLEVIGRSDIKTRSAVLASSDNSGHLTRNQYSALSIRFSRAPRPNRMRRSMQNRGSHPPARGSKTGCGDGEAATC